MVRMSAIYTGEKHCTAKHEPSQSLLDTDAPKDNQGKGEAFSPTDLIATALGTCMLTTMAIQGEPQGIDLKRSRLSIEKEMASNPRRVASLKTVIEMPASVPLDKRKFLEDAALNCPVKASLHPSMQIPVEFRYTL
ncbi:MAG: OsmC family protein [Pseudobdellovibrio sp.]